MPKIALVLGFRSSSYAVLLVQLGYGYPVTLFHAAAQRETACSVQPR